MSGKRSLATVFLAVVLMGWTHGTAVVVPDPDFTLSLASSLPSNVSCTRAGPATYFDASGNLQTAAINTPRFDYDPLTHTLLGLFLEGVQDAAYDGISTNLIRNNTMQGASVGVLPTNWSFNNNSDGLSAAVVATGTQQNIPYVDVEFSGTTSSGLPAILYFETTSSIANGVFNYGNSLYAELVAGSNANIINVSDDLEERNSGGTVLATVPGNNEYDSLPLSVTGLMRLVQTAVPNAVGTAFVVPGLTITPSGSGVAIDITIRIAGPQLEQNNFGATSLIQTSGTTATRAPDRCTITGGAGTALGGSNVTVMAGFTPGTQSSSHYRQFIGGVAAPIGFGADNYTVPNQTLSNNGSSLLSNATAFGQGLFPYLSAIAIAPGSRTLANGSASYGGTYANDNGALTLTSTLGCDSSFQSCPNGHFWSLSIWANTLTPAQLEAATAIKNATTAWGESNVQGVGSSIPYGGAPYGQQPLYTTYGWVGYIWSKSTTPMNIFNFGIGGQNVTQIETRMLADTLHVNDNVIIWMGGNDIPSDGSCPNTVVTAAQAMVAHLGSNTRYVLLDVMNWPAQGTGTNKYASIICMNNLLMAAFPGHVIDIRALVVAASGGSNDAPSYTWWFQLVPGSGVYNHLNDNGYRYVGEQIYQWGHSHGWAGY